MKKIRYVLLENRELTLIVKMLPWQYANLKRSYKKYIDITKEEADELIKEFGDRNWRQNEIGWAFLVSSQEKIFEYNERRLREKDQAKNTDINELMRVFDLWMGPDFHRYFITHR